MKLIKLEKEKELAERNQWIYALLALVFLIGGGAIFLTIKNRQKAEREKNHAELKFRKELLDATVNAQEDERQRIAKDFARWFGSNTSGYQNGVSKCWSQTDASRRSEV